MPDEPGRAKAQGLLLDFLSRGSGLLKERGEIYERHKSEIEAFQSSGISLFGNVVTAEDLRKIMLENMLEMAEPEIPDFKYVKFQADFLAVLDANIPEKISELENEILDQISIIPLVQSVESLERFRKYLYKSQTERRSLPEIDLDSYDLGRIDAAIVEYFIAMAQQFGLDVMLDKVVLRYRR